MNKIKVWLLSLAMTVGSYFGELVLLIALVLVLLYQGILT